MRRALVIVFALAAASATAAEPSGAVGGWVVPWQYDAGMRSLDRAHGALRDVFLFAARLDGAGHPVLDERRDGWSPAVARAHAAGARAWLTIVNDRVSGQGAPVLKDAEIVHRILADPETRAAHRSEIAALAKRLGVDGVDVDYENLPSWEREGFTTFARELAAELRAAGLATSITVQPKSGDTVSRGPGAMDWPALCGIADRLQVMLYNEHNASTEPGPIASLDWIARVIDHGLSACPAAKLVPVLKVSGMDWGPAKAEWRSFPEVTSIVAAQRPRIRRERYNRVPWFVYRSGDGRHVVYYEDAKSLGAKAARLRAKGLTALVLWSLGSEDPETISRLAAQKR
jgi:spore germination protein